jgi:hypothetical protein
MKAALLPKVNRIMMVDLMIMDPEQRAWFKKKEIIILSHEV